LIGPGGFAEAGAATKIAAANAKAIGAKRRRIDRVLMSVSRVPHLGQENTGRGRRSNHNGKA
jgi:hypothetical protein